jgi:hypothetical protein
MGTCYHLYIDCSMSPFHATLEATRSRRIAPLLSEAAYRLSDRCGKKTDEGPRPFLLYGERDKKIRMVLRKLKLSSSPDVYLIVRGEKSCGNCATASAGGAMG